jgi:hypothetical protein
MWVFNDVEFTESDIQHYTGFVYLITNLTNGKKYIGKKEFYKTIKRPPLKGKKLKRKTTVFTDWMTYTGSSNQLNQDIANGDTIRKDILKLVTSKSSATYYELKYQMQSDALFRDDYYNQIINVRINNVCVNNILKDK